MEWNGVIYNPSTNSSTWKVHHFQEKKREGGEHQLSATEERERGDGGMLLRHVSLICSPAANKNDDLQRILLRFFSFFYFILLALHLAEWVSQLESRWTSAIFIVYNEHDGEDGTPALGLIWRHPTRELTRWLFPPLRCICDSFPLEYCGVWSKNATLLCNKVTFNMPHRIMLIDGRMYWVWRALIALITLLCKGRHDRRNLMSVLFKSKADALMKKEKVCRLWGETETKQITQRVRWKGGAAPVPSCAVRCAGL